MIKEIFKVINEDTNKFFDSLYNSYGPGFFLLLSGGFLVMGLTPETATYNGSTVPAWLWWIFSGAYLVMYLDMKRRERKKGKNQYLRNGGKQ